MLSNAKLWSMLYFVISAGVAPSGYFLSGITVNPIFSSSYDSGSFSSIFNLFLSFFSNSAVQSTCVNGDILPQEGAKRSTVSFVMKFVNCFQV